SSFKLDLPSDMKARGLHPVFHASLLRIHIPNDDRRFPNRQQLLNASLGTAPADNVEWPVQKFISHSGSGSGLLFEVLWQSGDVSWEPLENVKHLDALASYLEALGVDSIASLP
ncbi:hypothetical protein SISSUDRAFT_973146, partial [Sistotremastrum suecicum HHB10207 ss-3]